MFLFGSKKPAYPVEHDPALSLPPVPTTYNVAMPDLPPITLQSHGGTGYTDNRHHGKWVGEHTYNRLTWARVNEVADVIRKCFDIVDGKPVSYGRVTPIAAKLVFDVHGAELVVGNLWTDRTTALYAEAICGFSVTAGNVGRIRREWGVVRVRADSPSDETILEPSINTPTYDVVMAHRVDASARATAALEARVANLETKVANLEINVETLRFTAVCNDNDVRAVLDYLTRNDPRWRCEPDQVSGSPSGKTTNGG